jgi:hypothetical protein
MYMRTRCSDIMLPARMKDMATLRHSQSLLTLALQEDVVNRECCECSCCSKQA